MARHPNLQRFLDGMAKAMDMDEPTAKRLMVGSEHPYHCDCATCLEWWASVGPECADGKTPTWGPFTGEQIRRYKKTGEITSIEEDSDRELDQGDG